MPASRQSDFRRAARGLGRRKLGARGFTLIELIFVLTLLAISAVFVTSNLGAFFRGRALNFEARRMLSLTQYGQSRAISEGVPVVLWLDPSNASYGLTVQSSFTDAEGDAHAVRYSVDPSLTLETPGDLAARVSENDDEKLGVTEGLAFIRFTPDGFFDPASVSKITIRQGNETALELVPTVNRLGYEIRPASNIE